MATAGDKGDVPCDDGVDKGVTVDEGDVLVINVDDCKVGEKRGEVGSGCACVVKDLDGLVGWVSDLFGLMLVDFSCFLFFCFFDSGFALFFSRSVFQRNSVPI